MGACCVGERTSRSGGGDQLREFGRCLGGIRLGQGPAALGHELIELSTVPSKAQSGEEILELALLVLKALQRLRTIFVKGAVPARRRAEPVAARF